MRGVIILSFHKKPGAFVDREYPKGISKQCNIDATEQNKIYSLHRMRNTKPNFLFVKVKNFQVSSYFTGFDFKEYLGHPNQCVSLVLEPNENPTKWEDYLRRLALDLLPKLAEVRGNEIPLTGLSDDPKFQPFDEILAETFQSLVENRLQPLPAGEGDVLEGKGTVIETVSGIGRSAPVKEIKNMALTKQDVEKAAAAQFASKSEMDPIKLATQQMENMEKDNLRNEIRNLHQIIQEKDNRIRALEIQVREASAHSESGGANDPDLSNKISKIKGEYEALLASKEQELDIWRLKVTELNETNFINQDNIRKLTEMTMMQTDDLSNQSKNIIELKKKVKTLEANQSAPATVDANDMSAMRVHLTEIEETLKNTNIELEKKSEQNKELFMKIKKLQTEVDATTSQNDQMKAENKKDQVAFNELLIKKDQELADARETLKNSALQTASASTEVSSEIKAKLAASEAQISQLKADLAIAETQLKSAAQNGPSDTISEGKLKELEAQVKTLQSELIDAKKTIKVQRREVENLQKLAGL